MFPSSFDLRFPAFKEWQIIVEALGAGEQILILRKGGIAEGPGGFDPAHAGRFWLFPTQFHAQHEKTKPSSATTRLTPSPAVDSPATLTLHFFAERVQHRFIDQWADVVRLDPFHVWTEATLREKFEWSRPPGLHGLVVRVYRLHQPITLPVTPAMSGCKSWIDLPVAFDATPASPVLDDNAFATRLKQFASFLPATPRV